MRKTTTKMIIVLMLAVALALVGCAEQKAPQSTGAVTDGGTVGEGTSTFSLSVIDAEEHETAFTVRTDAETVGEALLSLGMIDGDAGAYGLYIKTVNGITLDYDRDGKYWAFYIDGAYAVTGVDSTPVTDGASYMFKAE